MGEMLFNVGIIVAGVSIAAGIVAVIALSVSKRRLNEKLDNEYGKIK